jgi:hypothetical protein
MADNDERVLKRLYESTGGEQWKRNKGWLSHKPLSEWEGVKVNDKGRVVQLYLSLWYETHT